MHPTALPRTKRARVSALAVLLPLLSVMTACGSPVTAQGTQVRAAAADLGSALVGSAPVGNGPSELAVDAATHTIYVANGYNDNGPNAGGNTVSVIDARHCQAMDVSRCQGPWPTITVGNLPSTIAVDTATDTVYVTDTGANTVSVFNGATCNALVTSGCGQRPATVRVGPGPLGQPAGGSAPSPAQVFGDRHLPRTAQGYRTPHPPGAGYGPAAAARRGPEKERVEEAGEHVAQKLILTRGEDNIRDLLPGPILPPVIDKELLVDAEKELGLSLRAYQEAREWLRDAFWARVHRQFGIGVGKSRG